MAFEFELPDVGEGVAEGELVVWHVSPGDSVEEDDVLAEIETDKAVVDLPSPVTGTVVELHAEEGDVIPVGDVVITLEPEEDVPDEGEVEPDVEPDSAEGDTGAETAVDTEGTGGAETSADEGAASGADAAAQAENGDSPTAAAGGSDGVRVFAPPNVRRLAREMGVDITAVEGSGPGGRITERDVREAAGKGGVDDETVESAIASVDESVSASGEDEDRSEPQSTTATSDMDISLEGMEPANRDQTLAVPSTRRLAREEGVDIDAVPTEKTRDGEAFVEPEDVEAFVQAQTATEGAEPAAGAGETTAADTSGGATAAGTGRQVSEEAVTAETQEVTTEPYRGIRRTIGEKMEESAYTAPHVSHHDTAVVDALVETRAELKPRAEERGVRLTYLPFVMKAIVAGLKEYPVLNTTLDEESEEVVYKHFYNLGVAVATDAGLMVPVVENVDEKGILELASETNERITRARERSIAPEEMQGGTFSITNFGAIGGEYATPIINYPETAILGLGSIEQRPVVDESAAGDDPASTGEVVARHTLPLSLSIDHRVIDGAEAARFANTVIEHLENPQLLLLE
jgi:pyruvate dehydrogenase E2 component (dihydrolipoamide acetyltransferase)